VNGRQQRTAADEIAEAHRTSATQAPCRLPFRAVSHPWPTRSGHDCHCPTRISALLAPASRSEPSKVMTSVMRSIMPVGSAKERTTDRSGCRRRQRSSSRHDSHVRPRVHRDIVPVALSAAVAKVVDAVDGGAAVLSRAENFLQHGADHAALSDQARRRHRRGPRRGPNGLGHIPEARPRRDEGVLLGRAGRSTGGAEYAGEIAAQPATRKPKMPRLARRSSPLRYAYVDDG
jgi:hypothetical protein